MPESLGEPVSQVNFQTTDPDQRIEIARYNGFTDTAPRAWILTYRSFFNEVLAVPEPNNYVKNGPSFMIGPCRGKRGGANLERGFFAVVDADSSINEKNEVIEGAPPPHFVHEQLKAWNLSHCLYTTFSHGSDKGNRYRIVFPVQVENKAELKAFVMYIVTSLQNHGIPLALTLESYTWGNGWALPRVKFEGAEYYTVHHFGVVPSPADLVPYYNTTTIEKAPPNRFDQTPASGSPMSLFDKYLPIREQLEQAGYEYVSQTTIVDSEGRDRVAMRYRRPGSTSAPGVVLFEDSDGRMRVYSHHGTDPLNNGHANDAYDVWQILGGFGSDYKATLLAALPTLHEQIEAEMHERFPSVMEAGNKFKIGNIYTDDFGALTYRLLDITQFELMTQNRPQVPVEDYAKDPDGNESKTLKTISQAEFWRRSRNRVMYNGVVYQPYPINGAKNPVVEKHGDVYFNMFRTWHLGYKPGRWDLLEWHLRNSLCAGGEEEYEYLLNWFAHLFQFPTEKPGTALVLRGGRGLGKSVIMSELARALGTHGLVVGTNRLLTGNFNSHLRNKLLVVVEESFWSGSPKDRGVLQHLITDTATTYEKKQMDPEAGLSYIRVAMITNEDWAAPAAADERRYFVPTLSDASKQRDIKNGQMGHFFPALVREMRSGGLEAFVQAMIERPVSLPRLRKLPQTEGLLTQKKLSLDWLDRWLYTVLSDGRVRNKETVVLWLPDGLRISAVTLQASLESASPKASHIHHGVLTDFEARMDNAMGKGGLKKVNDYADGLTYVLPSLYECRQAFIKHTGIPIEWPEQVPVGGLKEVRNEPVVWTTH